MPLRRRLFFTILGTVIVTLLISLLAGGALVRRQLDQNQASDLGRELAVFAQAPDTARSQLALRLQGITLVTTSPADAVTYLPAGAARTVADGRAVSGTTGPNAHRVLYAARPVNGSVIVATRPASLPATTWRPFMRIFFWCALIGAGLAALAAWLVARRLAGPITQVAEASSALAAGEHPEPVPPSKTRELALLGSSFNHMADELDRSRGAERDFLLSVSHELKTPLTSLRGYGEALADGTIGAAEAGPVIGREAARLERLVGDLLDMGRAHQADFTVRRENVDLPAVIDDIAGRFRARAAEQRVAITTSTEHASPALADPDRLSQVLSNLVENALRVTDSGGTIAIAADNTTVTVSDDGPGIDPADLPRAFERFYLHDRYRSERATGTGLGLAIVRQLTEAMGGTVSVTSKPGEGARFTVTLPPAVVAPALPV